MKLVGRVLLGTLITGCIVLVGWTAAGCRSGERSPTADLRDAEVSKSRPEDAVAGSDAQRAKAALRAQQRDEGARRPAAPQDRTGTGVVDQPRVGGVRR